MSAARLAHLTDRGVVSVSGPDAGKLLQGLITNDLDDLRHSGGALYAGLLSPQGKILFDFFVAESAGGFLLDVARDKAADLVKRLTMYKLRANAVIADVSGAKEVFSLWGDHACSFGETMGTVSFEDPRQANLGRRILAETRFAADIVSAVNCSDASIGSYHAHRIALGVPEGGKDYDFGDAYPHEADFDLFHGVSFTKGCYVGQEIVARMQHKTVVRKRVVKVTGASALAPGTDIVLGEAAIGRIGSTDGMNALAMLRVDRAAEAEDKGIVLTAGGVAITPDEASLARYRSAATAASGVLK